MSFFFSAANSPAMEMPVKYASPLPNTQKEGYSAIYEANNDLTLEEEMANMDLRSEWAVFQRGLSTSGDRPCLGTCVKIEDGGEEKAAADKAKKPQWNYVWKTYKEVDEIVRAFGGGLVNKNLLEKVEIKGERYQQNFTFLGIGGANRLEWVCTDLAANALKCTVVPIYQTLGHAAVYTILSQTGMITACGDVRTCELLIKAKKEAEELKLENIIVFDEAIPADLQKTAQAVNIQLYTFQQIVDSGKGKAMEDCEVDGKHVSLMCYTSGTTGTPKGVMITNEGILSSCFAFYKSLCIYVDHNDVHLSYLPLAHIYERVVMIMFFAVGGRVGFFRGNPQLLLEDMQLLQPTVFPSVPRLFTKIYNQIMASVGAKNIAVQKLFNYALETKVKNFRASGSYTHRLLDALFFNKVKQQFGGKIRFMFTGSAPLHPDIQAKLSCLLCACIVEGWGMTETSGASFLQKSYDFIKGTVGGPTWVTQFKIQSVPELEYYADDKNSLTIKGELCVRGPSVFKGYFLKEEETRDALDDEGFLHSGDIVELLPNGAVKIIDRKKNIYKLAQGEYVSPEKIEAVYEPSSFVSQIFVHATSCESCLVGVVVLDVNEVAKWATENKIIEGEETAEKEAADKIVQTVMQTKSEELKKAIMNDFDALAKGKLMGFEKVKDIYMTTERFTIDNGLITPTLKLVRHKCQQAFEKQIKDMFDMLTDSRRSSMQ